MRIILLVAILSGFSTQIEGQSDTDTIFHPKQKIGFGISNVAKTIGVSLNDSNPFPKTIRYMAEYHHEIDTGLYHSFWCFISYLFFQKWKPKRVLFCASQFQSWR